VAQGTTFFEFAAALIPALIFGGLISDRLKPPRGPSHLPFGWILIALFLSGLFLVYAETRAIAAAVTGEVTSADRVIVSLAVVGLSLLALVLLLVPWIRKLSRAKETAAIGMLALILPGAAASVALIEDAISQTTAQEIF
jgi:hypothetical protein